MLQRYAPAPTLDQIIGRILRRWKVVTAGVVLGGAAGAWLALTGPQTVGLTLYPASGDDLAALAAAYPGLPAPSLALAPTAAPAPPPGLGRPLAGPPSALEIATLYVHTLESRAVQQAFLSQRQEGGDVPGGWTTGARSDGPTVTFDDGIIVLELSTRQPQAAARLLPAYAEFAAAQAWHSLRDQMLRAVDGQQAAVRLQLEAAVAQARNERAAYLQQLRDALAVARRAGVQSERQAQQDAGLLDGPLMYRRGVAVLAAQIQELESEPAERIDASAADAAFLKGRIQYFEQARAYFTRLSLPLYRGDDVVHTAPAVRRAATILLGLAAGAVLGIAAALALGRRPSP